MQRPDDPNDELSDLFSALRAAPPAADSVQVALGFETRVLARVHAAPAHAADTLRWFWRWSAVFGAVAIICAVLVVQNYEALNDESLAALDGGGALFDWSD